MKVPTSKDWQDLPKRMNCFTVRSAVMLDLDTGKIIRHYSANTKIAVVQKYVTPDCTYYRTAEASENSLNYAFKASAFGMPDESAPSAPTRKVVPNNPKKYSTRPGGNPKSLSPKKNKKSAKEASSKDGKKKPSMSWLKKLFRKGKDASKNS